MILQFLLPYKMAADFRHVIYLELTNGELALLIVIVHNHS